MIKFLISILLISCFVLTGYWFAENTTDVTFLAFGYEIKTNIFLAIIMLLILVIITSLIFKILNTILFLPSSIREYLAGRKRNAVIENLVLLGESLFIKDEKQISVAANKLYSLLEFLDVAKSLRLYISSIVHPKISLSIAKDILDQRSGNMSAALYVFVKLNTKADQQLGVFEVMNENIEFISSGFLVNKYIELGMNLRRFKLLLDFLKTSNAERLYKSNILALKSTVFLELAKEANAASDYENAASLSEQALKVSESNDHAFELLIASYIALNYKSKAVKYVKKYWKDCQGEIATRAVLKLSDQIPTSDMYQLGMDLDYITKGSYESKIVLIKSAINATFYDQAFQELSNILEIKGKTKRLCIIMSELSFRTNGSGAEVIDWLKESMTCEDN
ncbi:MAG: hypothetical protein ACK5WS_04710 [Alphaproteobacteria bacterium]|jgi:uncharacterized membrane-anchored protein